MILKESLPSGAILLLEAFESLNQGRQRHDLGRPVGMIDPRSRGWSFRTDVVRSRCQRVLFQQLERAGYHLKVAPVTSPDKNPDDASEIFCSVLGLGGF